MLGRYRACARTGELAAASIRCEEIVQFLIEAEGHGDHRNGIAQESRSARPSQLVGSRKWPAQNRARAGLTCVGVGSGKPLSEQVEARFTQRRPCGKDAKLHGPVSVGLPRD